MQLREPIQSPMWYRIAALKPTLRVGVRVSRQLVRGQAWYVLNDPLTGRHHRFNEPAYRLLALCNGERSIDEIWAAQAAGDGSDAPTQGQAMQVFRQAHEAHLLAGSVAPDVLAVLQSQQRGRKLRHNAAVNPLSFKLPLWDPDRFLGAHAHRVAALLGAAGPGRGLAWALALVGVITLLLHAGDLAAYGDTRLGSPRLLLLLWLAYPLMKLVHELAHAFTVKLHGGEVHEIGVTLMFLTPVPYVDASASAGFDQARDRIAVAAAGILVELLLAGLALVLWLLLEDGLARDASFAVVVVGGLSTLLVNGNPLLRFDGYFVFCDAAGLPNLGLRSLRWWQVQLQRRWLGTRHARFGPLAPGERAWLIAYAPLAWAYRSALLLGLALLAAGWSAMLGLVLLGLALWLGLARPLMLAGRWIATAPEAAGRRLRAGVAAALPLVAALLIAFVVPLPQRSHAPAVVWLPDDAVVRLAVAGVVEEILVADGQSVSAGAPMARLQNEPLRADLQRVQAQLQRQEVDRAGSFDHDAARAATADENAARLRAEEVRLTTQVEQLIVRAAIDGQVMLRDTPRELGRWLEQGHTLARVLPPGAPIVRALIHNDDIELVRAAPGKVRVALATAAPTVLVAQPGRVQPQATSALPTAALGDSAGGTIALDPADARGMTAREPRFQLDLTLPAGVAVPVGTRALVTFTHGSASLARLAARAWRGAFLRHFER